MFYFFFFLNLPKYFTLLSEDEKNYKFIVRIITNDSYICIISYFCFSNFPDNRLTLFCLMFSWQFAREMLYQNAHVSSHSLFDN